ncbi:hypothetical protein [Nocardia sp. NPDC051570]|uniref:hypothetical protein n=1 Tax=Nocardia sp. NPDC051570 TaxID=3364324 RepID=UPI0037A3AB68
MIVIIGLVVLVAAALVGFAVVFAKVFAISGGHAMTDNFAVFGYHVTGSAGVLFLCCIVVGCIGIAGLGLVLAGARRELETAARDTPIYEGQTGTIDVAADTHVATDVPGTDAPGTVAGQGIGSQPAPGIPSLGNKLFGHASAGR